MTFHNEEFDAESITSLNELVKQKNLTSANLFSGYSLRRTRPRPSFANRSQLQPPVSHPSTISDGKRLSIRYFTVNKQETKNLKLLDLSKIISASDKDSSEQLQSSSKMPRLEELTEEFSESESIENSEESDEDSDDGDDDATSHPSKNVKEDADKGLAKMVSFQPNSLISDVARSVTSKAISILKKSKHGRDFVKNKLNHQQAL